MVESVLHTFDYGDNLEYSLLFSNLGSLDVRVMAHSARSTSLSDEIGLLDSKLRDVDLVMYDSGRIAVDKDDNGFRRTYAAAVEELIYQEYLHKTHLTGNAENGRFDKLTFCRAVETGGIPIPQTWDASRYIVDDKQTLIVVKHKRGRQGNQVYCFRAHKLAEFFDEKLYNDWGMEAPQRKDYLVQEFVPTPSNRFTHYRVFTVGDEILGVVLNVSAKKQRKEWISHPDDPSWWNEFEFTSNSSQGGVQIPLSLGGRIGYFNRHRKIVRQHGIDSRSIKTPPQLEDMARAAAEVLQKNGVAFGGQDWIQDPDGNCYFLEINTRPGLNIFNVLFFGGKADRDGYLSLALERIAEALTRFNPSQ
jgi:hypothetical protein